VNVIKKEGQAAISVERRIAFGDCDPAGIVYTPRALDYCLEAIDEFWKIVLDGRGWYELNVDLDRGTPFVNINIDFTAPMTARDLLVLDLTLLRLGATSVTFGVHAQQGERTCFRGSLTSVLVTKSTVSKVAHDDWTVLALRKAIAEWTDG